MEGEKKKYIPSEELKKHNKPGDLWISIQGKVYNVSDWAKEHPSGEIPILNLAGQDVTDAFMAYHPDTAWQYLDKFFTGHHLKDFKVSEVSRDYRKLVAEFVKLGLFDKKEHVTLYTLTSVAVMFAIAANVYVGPPNGNDWFEKQTSETLDISCSTWMDWFVGGLQFQLEHHLLWICFNRYSLDRRPV